MPDLKAMNLMSVHRELQRRSSLTPETLIAEYAHPCPYCGGPIAPVIGEFAHPTRPEVVSRPLMWPARHGCPQETAILKLRAQQELDERERLGREAWAASLVSAGLIGDLAGKSFDNFKPRQDWPDAIACLGRVKAYSYALLNGELTKPWLILYGGYGTGKSHLAAAIIRAALEAGWNDCYFRVWTEYLNRIKASWDRGRNGNDGETEYDIEAELRTGRLVAIDDLDKKRPTDWARETLFGVVNHRYNAKLPTIFTFNYGPEDQDQKTPGQLALVSYLGEAVVDRLTDAKFDTIEFDGPSYRSKVKWEKSR